MNIDLRKKKQRVILKKTFLSLLIMQFMEKLLKTSENIDIVNVLQQK